MTNIKYQINLGFTYIELLLYTGIVAIVITALVPFAWHVVSGGAKSATEQEVFSNARFISERIKYEIRNATGINAVSAAQISLVTSSAATNPTVIDLSAGDIRIKQGTGSVVKLNSNDTMASNLVFTDYTSSDNKTKHIGFTLTLTDANTSTRQEFQETTTIESSAEIRSN
ncbi:MAG: hypothetical protein HY431_01900 [Candidatus Levybacteria bacterium]|nr:hypothetical protein [Candidatus Levybacteria bacterium]